MKENKNSTMKFLKKLSSVLFFCSIFSVGIRADLPAYKNPELPIESRVADLLGRMSLDEKVAQLQAYRISDTLVFDENGNFVSVLDTAALNLCPASVRVRRMKKSQEWHAKVINGIQKYMLEKTRLGIPSLFFSESLHGYMEENGTSFPQAIALASSWDTVLVEKVFTAAALEAASRGTNQVLSPVLDLARDPRWGRTEECYSEDPYLASRMAIAAIFGLQGRKETIDRNHVAATLKHFAGHGQAEGGRNRAPVNYSERDFRETHLYPFEIAVKKAKAHSIMASYNEWDGVPNHLNHKLLTDILRNEWNFQGYVMTDGGGLAVAHYTHCAAKDSAEIGNLALNAGIDYDLTSIGYFSFLKEEIMNGRLDEAVLDRAVRNVLWLKFTMGLFENPFADIELMKQVTNCDKHKALARKAAQEAVILLKNEKQTLPLDKNNVSTIAVIGPNAKGIHLGTYTPRPMVGIDVLSGIQQYANQANIAVKYAKGCNLTLNEDCHWLTNERAILSDPEEDKRLIKEAVKVAKKCDAVILVIGENELINREAWNEVHVGDAENLNLVGAQNELARALFETGKPVVVVLINGRPLSINDIAEKADAIMEAWYLGQETGHAIADIIFGDVNPSGKLTVTFPRSVGQLPCFYNKKPSRDRSYALANSTPLFPFGFGLSYTNFDYHNLQLSKDVIQQNESVKVTVDICNTGKVAGDEIVQLYIRDMYGVPTRPVMELKDFTRISLEPGETETVVFRLTPDKLEAYNLDMKREIQPGEFRIIVGKNSVEFLSDTLMVVE